MGVVPTEQMKPCGSLRNERRELHIFTPVSFFIMKPASVAFFVTCHTRRWVDQS